MRYWLNLTLFLLGIGLWFLAYNYSCFGQSLMLPSPPRIAEGKGACVGHDVLLTSDQWRVKKGRTFKVQAAQPFDENYRWKYDWTVTNGRIVTGQSTSIIEVKAGGKKTKGYINADGFVRVQLSVTSVDGNCSLQPETTIMVGRFGESNGSPNVDGLELNTAAVSTHCTGMSESVIGIETAASDPENDVLLYVYRVSAGKIIGTGSKVKWNLSDVPPGEYRIAVGVDDGFGIRGRTAAKIITVKPCENLKTQ